MVKSEIIENYLEIVKQAGLLSNAKESKELQDYKNTTNPRVSSDDISTIEALYGVKPEGQDYDFNIVEKAHPAAVIIAPSHDKINALVENVNERQNIIVNIVQSPTDGRLSKKYAEKELLFELIRIATDMDNRDQHELRNLADNCIATLLNKPIQKQAIGPFAIAGIVAGVLAATWLLSHANDPDRGLLENCNNAISQLNDLKENSWYESAVDATVQAEAEKLVKDIERLKSSIVDFNSIRDKIFQPKSLEDMAELNKLKNVADTHGDEIKDKTQKFKNQVMNIEPELQQAIENFTSSAYQLSHTKPSWLSSATGYLGEVLHGRWGLIANDFISAANALSTLYNSMKDMKEDLTKLPQVEEKYKEKIENVVPKSEEEKMSPLAKSEPKQEKEDDSLEFIRTLMGDKKLDPEQIAFLKQIMKA